MPLFVLLTKLTGKCKQKLRDEPEILEEICNKLGGCDKGYLPQLATLGQYNFVNIVKVDDEKTAYTLSLELNSRGDTETIVLPAMPIEEYLKEIKKMTKNN
jgi:uncharacterized protein with GYD domain